MAKQTWVKVTGVWKECTPWINVNGTWKHCIPWVRVNGIWKQCYSGNSIMTVYIPTSGDNSSQSQSRIISIPSLSSIVECTVNTGSVSYSVSGTNVTLNVSNGTSVRHTTDSRNQSDYRQTAPGGNPDTFPGSILYDSGGYSGYLPRSGIAHVVSGTAAGSRSEHMTLSTSYPGAPASSLPDYYDYNSGGFSGRLYPTTTYTTSGSDAGSKYCTGTAGDTIIVVDGEVISGTIPGYIPYNDGEYSGNLDPIGVNSAYINNYNAFLDALENDTSWSGYILYDYGATLSKSDTRIWSSDYSGVVSRPDTRIWQQDYYGIVYGSTTYYYAYIVTLTYNTT